MPGLFTSSIEEDVVQALAGADYVQEQLLVALRMGPNNLFKKTYAIKCRIKEKQRFVEKIHKKQQGNPTYKASDVTDVVGLRVVCIFAEELPETVKGLITFLEFCQTAYVGLLPQKALSDAIHEAIVYYTAGQEVHYRSAYEYLASLNLGHSADGKQKLKIEAATHPDPYSSIHLVVFANSHYASSVKRIPVEIQVRTTLEDTWAEIDHPRRYKGPGSIYANNPESAQLKKRLDNRMERLKRELDIASENASDIKADYDALMGGSAEKRRATTATTQRVGVRPMCSATAPTTIRDSLVSIERRLTALLIESGLQEVRAGATPQPVDVLSCKTQLKTISNELGDTKEVYEQNSPTVYREDRQFLYYYRTEAAYMYYMIARIERSSADFDSTVFNAYYKKAMKEYFDALDDNRYENDSLIYFRIGSVYVLGGQIALAVLNYRKATNVLVDDALLPADSIYRAIIPRHTGYVLWLHADQLVKEGERDDNYHMKSQGAELIKDAIEITFGWYRRLKDTRHPAFIADTGETEELVSYHNNILYYSARYVALRSVDSLKHDCKIDEATIDKMYESFSLSDDIPLNRMDTMVNVGMAFGKFAEAKLWAEKLQSGLDDPRVCDRYTKQQVDWMRDSVEKALRTS